jgi:hypothetical protein
MIQKITYSEKNPFKGIMIAIKDYTQAVSLNSEEQLHVSLMCGSTQYKSTNKKEEKQVF